MQQIQFASQSYAARSADVSAERLVNMYLEANPATAKTPVSVYGTPGLKLWADVGVGPVRGMRKMGAYVYIVSGEMLYAVSSDGVAQEIDVISGTGNVHMTDNGVHVGIAASRFAYAANRSGVLALPEEYLCGAEYQDGYGIFPKRGTEQFFLSGLDDMTDIGATDYSTADAFADNLIAAKSDHRELYLFGESTVERWYNSGDAGFPFSRSAGGFIEKGCISSHSPSKIEHRVIWLGHDLSVYMAAGADPQTISNPAIHKMISAVSDPSGAVSFSYKQEEHAFYVLSFSGLTLCYDLITGLWHERSSENVSRWRANCYEYAFGRHLVGDFDDGRVYELDLNTFDDDGDEIRRIAVTPPVASGLGRSSFSSFCLDMETGVAPLAGQGSDPKALLDWSDDGGRSWSNQIESGIGRRGQYGSNVIWNRLGMSGRHGRHFRVTISDPVKVAIHGAYVEADPRL